MAAGDPTEITVPAWSWTKVLTNKTSGAISVISPRNEKWYWTQWSTGSAAPTTEKPRVELEGQTMVVDSSVAVDVYLFLSGTTAGLVRVV